MAVLFLRRGMREESFSLKGCAALLEWSKLKVIPVARKADSLYGFQFRRNLNLCVHLAVTSREVVRLFLEQLRFDFVPVFHYLQGRFAA